MLFRTRIGALALLLALAAALCGCAKKKHVASHPFPAPLGPETGIASWYGHPYHGRPAANGEIYDMEQMTAAHRTLPFGTWVRVNNLTNGKTVDVRIIDRGPFIDGRIIDISHAAARAIDLIGPGIAQVRLDIIAAPPAASIQELYAIQIGAFRDRDRAERLWRAMEQQFGSARIVLRAGNPNLWRVLAGTATNMEDANRLADQVRAQAGEALVVRVDPQEQIARPALKVATQAP
jgi:rare lipoprotein A